MRLELRGVVKGYRLAGSGGWQTVLGGIDLEIASGERCLLSGPSGSGKSTLLAILAGLAAPGAGSIRWFDRRGQPLEDRRYLWRQLGYASQEPVFFPELTVWENLLLPALQGGQNILGGRVESLLAEFGLAERQDWLPATLSGGEKRRLSVARALLCRPQLLLLDEPTAYLDDAWRERLLQLVVREVRENGATLVLASHERLPGIEPLRVVRMRCGMLAEEEARVD